MIERGFKPSVRYTNGLRIYFKDKHTVQVSTSDVVVNISRWAIKQRGYYRDVWKPFCEKLYRLNSLNTIWDVMDLATKYELDIYSSYDLTPQPIPDSVWVRPAIYRYQRRNNGNI